MSPWTRERLGAGVTVAGIVASLPSVWHTAGHIKDPAFRTTTPYGTEHVAYHMAREVLTAAGSLTAVGIGALCGARRTPTVWRVMAAAAGGYCAALWSGGPVTGVWAPNRRALLVHAAGTAGLLTGVCLLRPRPMEWTAG
ncbi:hypothetical protein G6045_21520 [Streptomyces sp. YC504]|uniref:DUF998 domain-containing protein n=1 Tax=Streptomyces mesophilus TaxID=1775132 RepID=A0A6G4XM09_9ACTN|nr:hypothetical protein [Streptomyces mesophilus]NGO78222.1 hypothetical protein [Streptomyces mesophilus]